MGLLAKPYLQRISARFGADVDLESYPYNVPSVRTLEAIDFHADVTFFIGENGAGKSTVLEAIALALGFNMEGGTKGVQLNTAHQAAPLHQSLKMSRSYKAPRDGYFFRAESFHNVATYMDEIVPTYLGSYGGGFLHVTEVAYEDTEHFAITRDFLNHYPRRLEQLLKSE